MPPQMTGPDKADGDEGSSSYPSDSPIEVATDVSVSDAPAEADADAVAPVAASDQRPETDAAECARDDEGPTPSSAQDDIGGAEGGAEDSEDSTSLEDPTASASASDDGRGDGGPGDDDSSIEVPTDASGSDASVEADVDAVAPVAASDQKLETNVVEGKRDDERLTRSSAQDDIGGAEGEAEESGDLTSATDQTASASASASDDDRGDGGPGDYEDPTSASGAPEDPWLELGAVEEEVEQSEGTKKTSRMDSFLGLSLGTRARRKEEGPSPSSTAVKDRAEGKEDGSEINGGARKIGTGRMNSLLRLGRATQGGGRELEPAPSSASLEEGSAETPDEKEQIYGKDEGAMAAEGGARKASRFNVFARSVRTKEGPPSDEGTAETEDTVEEESSDKKGEEDVEGATAAEEGARKASRFSMFARSVRVKESPTSDEGTAKMEGAVEGESPDNKEEENTVDSGAMSRFNPFLRSARGREQQPPSSSVTEERTDETEDAAEEESPSNKEEGDAADLGVKKMSRFGPFLRSPRGREQKQPSSSVTDEGAAEVQVTAGEKQTEGKEEGTVAAAMTRTKSRFNSLLKSARETYDQVERKMAAFEEVEYKVEGPDLTHVRVSVGLDKTASPRGVDEIDMFVPDTDQGGDSKESALSPEEEKEAAALNVAFKALESMRLNNLQVELGAPDGAVFDPNCCAECLREEKRGDVKRHVVRMRSAQILPHHRPRPCLVCGDMACVTHRSSLLMRRKGLTVCSRCVPLILPESPPQDVDEMDGEGKMSQADQIKHMVDAYDRALILLRYSSLYISDIICSLDAIASRNDHVGLASSTTNMISGGLGIAAAATVLTPVGPPLLIASLIFGGAATATSAGNEAVNYSGETWKLADKIIALHAVVTSILDRTAKYCDELLNRAQGDMGAIVTKSPRADDSLETTLALSLGINRATQRSISRATTNAMKTAPLIPVVNGVMGAATILLEARDMTMSVRNLMKSKARMGAKVGDDGKEEVGLDVIEMSSCERANALRDIQGQIDRLPPTEVLAKECELFLTHFV